jgi:hypothetical protein
MALAGLAGGGRHPHALPAVLVVFAGKDRTTLERRIQTVLALARADPEICSAADLGITCTLLEDLLDHGPYARIFLLHDTPSKYVASLGEPTPASLS